MLTARQALGLAREHDMKAERFAGDAEFAAKHGGDARSVGGYRSAATRHRNLADHWRRLAKAAPDYRPENRLEAGP